MFLSLDCKHKGQQGAVEMKGLPSLGNNRGRGQVTESKRPGTREGRPRRVGTLSTAFLRARPGYSGLYAQCPGKHLSVVTVVPTPSCWAMMVSQASYECYPTK